MKLDNFNDLPRLIEFSKIDPTDSNIKGVDKLIKYFTRCLPLIFTRALNIKFTIVIDRSLKNIFLRSK